MGKVWEVIKNTIKWLWDSIKGFFYKDKREVDTERVFQQFQEDIVDKKEGELIVIGKNMRERADIQKIKDFMFTERDV